MPARLPRKTIHCETCNKLMDVRITSTQRFCSVDCHNQKQQVFLDKSATCPTCGKHFVYRSTSRYAEQICCSLACSNTYRANLHNEQKRQERGTRQCVQCRKVFAVKDYESECCSIACRNQLHSGANSPTWRGGHPEYYGPDWLSQRRKARERDSYTCRHCGITETALKKRLDVHHIRPFREFGYMYGENDNYRQANDLQNLICFCPTCHKAAEFGRIAIQIKLI